MLICEDYYNEQNV